MKDLQQRDEVGLVIRLDEPQEKPSTRPDLVEVVEVRVPLTVAVPLIAIAGVVLVVGLFALVLMRLPQSYAAPAAGISAVVIIAATALVASRKELTKKTLVELSALVVYPVALAAILVNVLALAN